MKLKDLLEEISVLQFIGNRDEEIQGISYSSKTVRPGYLFAALKGEKSDGFNFTGEALTNGAAAVLSDRPMPADLKKTWIQVSDARKTLALCSANFYSHPSKKMKIIGVTGTKGKTTITYLLEEIIKTAGFHPGVIGTISYRWPSMKIPAVRTTPEAPDLHKMLRKMLDHGTSHCVMEVSSHSLELKRVDGINFDVVVFSNLSGEHLDYHHSMEKYFQAKKRLFFLNRGKGTAIINNDDPWGKKLISQLNDHVLTYGFEYPALIRVEKYDFNENGIKASIKHPEGNISVTSPLLGKPNLYNILASISSALTLNIPVPAIEEGLTSLQGVPGRFEKIKNQLGLNIFVDYAHTDDALKNLLETARELNPRKIILVFGAGGDRDKTKRARMGKIAGTLADWTILTSDNPRLEDPQVIISNIEEGVKKTGSNKYEIQADREKAIKQAISYGKRGDTILVAGKGHENYQIIKDKIFPFDDVTVVKKILKEMEES